MLSIEVRPPQLLRLWKNRELRWRGGKNGMEIVILIVKEMKMTNFLVLNRRWMVNNNKRQLVL